MAALASHCCKRGKVVCTKTKPGMTGAWTTCGLPVDSSVTFCLRKGRKVLNEIGDLPPHNLAQVLLHDRCRDCA